MSRLVLRLGSWVPIPASPYRFQFQLLLFFSSRLIAPALCSHLFTLAVVLSTDI